VLLSLVCLFNMFIVLYIAAVIALAPGPPPVCTVPDGGGGDDDECRAVAVFIRHAEKVEPCSPLILACLIVPRLPISLPLFLPVCLLP
jgi:hypothetical protein